MRPILSDNCLKCHGFDPATREADRRFDTRDGARADIEGVRAVVPGDLKKSDLWERIHSTDQDEQAPPPQILNPIDSFIRARLEKENLQPSPAADPDTLIRRLLRLVLRLVPKVSAALWERRLASETPSPSSDQSLRSRPPSSPARRRNRVSPHVAVPKALR